MSNAVVDNVKALTVPVGDVLVGDTGGHIEHDDTALSVDVVTIAKTTELLLTSSVPDVELDVTQVLAKALVGPAQRRRNGQSGVAGGAYGVESERVHFDTESGDVLLLELASQVALDEGGLSGKFKVSNDIPLGEVEGR